MNTTASVNLKALENYFPQRLENGCYRVRLRHPYAVERPIDTQVELHQLRSLGEFGHPRPDSNLSGSDFMTAALRLYLERVCFKLIDVGMMIDNEWVGVWPTEAEPIDFQTPVYATLQPTGPMADLLVQSLEANPDVRHYFGFRGTYQTNPNRLSIVAFDYLGSEDAPL